LIEERFELIHLDYGIDYRLLALSQEVLWFGVNQQQRYMNLFDQLAIGLDELSLYIQYSGPDIILQRHHLGILMLDFKYLVAQPLGKSDYLHITTEYHTIFISNLYCLNYKNDEARRFIWFIDMCYDHKVKLVVLATIDIDHIYSANQPLSLEFSRTHSRMIEMQSSSYLANAHTTHNFKFL
jgi:cell division protein ZapE